MDLVNVLVVSSIGDDCLHKIASVSPKIELRDASDLWISQGRVSEQKKGFPKDKFEALLSQAEVLYGYSPPGSIIARAPKLKWIQTMLAGVDHFLDADIVQSPVIVTNTRGMHGTQVSELAFEMMLMLAKQAPLCFNAKQKKKWQPFTPAILRSKMVGIVGLGTIGKEVARLAKAFGMGVLAIDETRGTKRARHVDTMLPIDQLPQLLAESDFVVLTLPLTPKTNNLIGEGELRTMKSTAYLINSGRGGVVDEEALIRALDQHWIAGAGLDAFTTEPLPTESRLWGLPNVILSPHVGGRLENYNAIATELFCKNLRHYLSGEKLINVVNKKKGY